MKTKGMGKDITQHNNTNLKKTEVLILISDKADFRTKKFIKK